MSGYEMPNDHDPEQKHFAVISLDLLRYMLAKAYEATPDAPTPVFVELMLADILEPHEKGTKG